jgi:hypothetical protein
MHPPASFSLGMCRVSLWFFEGTYARDPLLSMATSCAQPQSAHKSRQQRHFPEWQGPTAQRRPEARFADLLISQIREANLHGLRAAHTFRCAATKYLRDNAHKKTIEDEALHLKVLDRFIGSLELKEVHGQ